MHSILIVDDRDEMRQLLSLLFATHGYQVTTAGCGDDALALAEAHTFDFALVDWQMPGMDGIAVSERLLALAASRHQNLGVWMMTGAPPNRIRVAAAKVGCRGVFAKPLPLKELLQELQQYQPSGAALA